MIIGISGKAGSGKTILCDMLVEKYNLIKLDCDTIAKDLKTEYKFDIQVDENGFIDEEEQERIINKFHPLVWNRIQQKIDNYKSKQKKIDIVVETALPSDRFFDLIDISFCIKSEKIKQRLKNDRNYTDKKIDAIIKSQEYYNKYYNKCDFIILNDNNITIAFDKICDIYESIKRN